MFCSNCGKTLKPEDDRCPHCGAAVGESRFEGNPPYTAAQEKLRPGKAVRSYGKHYSTEFVVNREDDPDTQSDTDSIYRAAMGLSAADDEPELFNAEQEKPAPVADDSDADEPAEDEEEDREKVPFGLRFLRRKTQEEPEEEQEDIGADEEVGEDGLTESERRAITADEFVPVEPKGISSDVSSYMQVLKRNAERKQEKQARKAKPAPAVEDELSEDEFTDRARTESKAAKKTKAAKPVKPAKPAKPVEPEEDADWDVEAEDEEKQPRESLLSKLRKARKEKPAKQKTEKPADKKKKKPQEPAPEEEIEPEDEDFDFEDEEFESERKERFGFLKKLRRSGEESAETDDDGEEDEEGEYTDERFERDEQRKARFRTIKNIAVIVVALAVIVGAVIGVSGVREKSKTAPIETVTLSLWNEGIALMESRCSDKYRVGMLGLYDKNNPASYTVMQARFTEDLDSLEDLLPETPMQHDQLFINALKAIQESINNCLSNDALSMTDGTKTTAEKNADSALRWESVSNIVGTLERATNIGQLEAIIKGERVELIQKATAVPDPTATPAPYTTLAKGASGPAVTNLQQRLTELGYMTSSIDGDYGNKTKTAVEKFQQKAGLNVTGIADVATQELLFSSEAPKAK